ncbi:MAG: ion transporter [SAR324 cluster bacterium]|nr:ion transporter [SAR324 cluster bacterium]
MSHKIGHREKLRIIIFEADTPMGKFFDEAVIFVIVFSVFAVMLESVADIKDQFGEALFWLEWFFTIVFTLEYIIRIYCINKPFRYIFSFFGIVDLLAILPTYLSLILSGTHILVVVRILRVLRIFRILKLTKYIAEAQTLSTALVASQRKITIFLTSILVLVVILGSTMYVIEGAENGFTSIPHSMYWAVVTLTTVGYGDVSPQTNLGKALASVVMILGYGIIAVPTGIVSAEIAKSQQNINTSTRICPDCNEDGHDRDSQFCRHCGTELD